MPVRKATTKKKSSSRSTTKKKTDNRGELTKIFDSIEGKRKSARTSARKKIAKMLKDAEAKGRRSCKRS